MSQEYFAAGSSCLRVIRPAGELVIVYAGNRSSSSVPDSLASQRLPAHLLPKLRKKSAKTYSYVRQMTTYKWEWKLTCSSAVPK